MIRYLLILLSLLGILTQANAQNFLVYSVSGDASTVVKNKITPITTGMVLANSSKLIIKNGGQLIILDEANARLFTIKSEYSGQLKSLLPHASFKQISSSYLGFLKQRITGKPTNIDDSRYKQTTGTSYRDSDSLINLIRAIDSASNH